MRLVPSQKSAITARRRREFVFDIYDLLLRGDRSADLRLRPGDLIFVPIESKRVSIEGAVKRPAVYETIKGESVGQLVEMAGGFKSDAYRNAVSLSRVDSEKGLPSIMNLNCI